MDNLMSKLCPIKYTKFRDFTFLANIIHAVHLSTQILIIMLMKIPFTNGWNATTTTR